MLTPLGPFIAAAGLTNLADGVAVVAWAWLASLMTRDALLIALVPVALRLPWFLLALPAGIVTDRTDRRRLILTMDAVRAGAVGVAALAIWLALPLGEPPLRGVSSPWLFAAVFGAALVVGSAEVFRDNAAQTMIPAIVPHAALERANGKLWSVELVGNALIGPALGAVLIVLWLPLPFVLNALAFGAAALLIATITGTFTPDRSAVRDWRRELAEGYVFLRGMPVLITLAIVTGFWNLFHQVMIIALVLHVQENLGLSAEIYGLILTGGAIGGVIGSLAAPWVVARIGPLSVMRLTLTGSPVAFLLIALASGPVGLALAIGLMELSGFMWNVVSVSLRQRTIPDRLLGRVNSIYRLLAWGMMPLGLILSGVIVRIAGLAVPRAEALTAPFWAAALGTALLALVGWRALGRGFRSL